MSFTETAPLGSRTASMRSGGSSLRSKDEDTTLSGNESYACSDQNSDSDHREGPDRTPTTVAHDENEKPQEQSKWFKAAETLPPGIGAMYKFLFLALLQHDDPFPLVMRKMMITCSLLFAPFPIVIAIYWCATGARDGFSDGLTAATIGVFGLSFVSFIPTYAIVRATSRASDWMIDYWTLTTLVFLTVVGYGVTQFASASAAFALTMCSAIAGPPLSHQLVHLVFSAIAFLLPVYNSSVAHTSWFTFQASTPYVPPAGQALALALVAYVITIFMFLALLVMGMEFKSTLTQAEAGLDMTAQVAVELTTYNTDGVETLLEHCKEESLVTNELLQLFTAINNNLCKYRPHLPNWLMNEMEEETESRGPASLCPSGALDTASGKLSISSLAAPNRGSVSPLNRKSSSDNNSNRSASSLRQNSAASIQESQSKVLASVSTAIAGGSHSDVYEGFIPYAVVDFAVSCTHSKSDTVSHFVDLVHHVAGKTKAALHSFVGDRVVATWNATTRVAAAERKAVAFLNALRTDAPAMTLTGAVMTAQARCQFSGAKTRALTVDTPWKETLERLVKYAAQHRTFCVCNRTHSESSLHFLFRGVDAIEVPDWRPSAKASPTSSSRRVNIFELVDEVGHDDDEWMYALEQTKEKAGPNDVVTEALGKAVEGDIGAAVSLLESLQTASPDVYQASTVSALLAKCDSLLRSKGASMSPLESSDTTADVFFQ